MTKIAPIRADQYMLRLPPGLRERVKERATQNGRSINTEIISALEQHLEQGDNRLAVVERKVEILIRRMNKLQPWDKEL